MNISKVSFGDLRANVSQSNEDDYKDAMFDFEKSKCMPKHIGQYKSMKSGDTRLIFALPQTENEIFINLQNAGINVEKVNSGKKAQEVKPATTFDDEIDGPSFNDEFDFDL